MIKRLGLSKTTLFPIALIGLHFSWLLSCPLWGPVLVSLSAQKNGDPFITGLSFMLSSAVGLVLYAISPKHANRLTPQKGVLATIITIVSTLSLLVIPTYLWYIPGILSGLASAMIVSYWSKLFVEAITYAARGRIVAFFVISANLLLYLMLALSRAISPEFQLVLCIIPLLVTIRLLTSKKHSTESHGNDYTESSVAIWEGTSALNLLNLVFFFFAFYFSAGLLVDVVYSGMNVHFPGLATYYSVIPYIVASFAAGYEADKRGRRHLPIKAWTFLGLGLAIILLPKDARIAYLFSTTLSLAAYGYGDVFLWTYMGDIAKSPAQAPCFYGFGTAVNLIAVSAGAAVMRTQTYIESSSTLIVGLGLTLLFMMLIPLLQTIDTIHRDSHDLSISPMPLESAQVEDADKTTDLDATYMGDMLSLLQTTLTQRETEVLMLLVKGLSNSNIAEHLNLAEPTVKTHLRNIYRKTGCPNRRSLLSSMITTTQLDNTYKTEPERE